MFVTQEETVKIRQRLGIALVQFVSDLLDNQIADKQAVRRKYTARFRREVEYAASHQVESSLTWHTLGFWTENGKGRIGCFSRALEMLDVEASNQPPATHRARWGQMHTRADCLYEIGRVHATEGAPSVARYFLEKAYALLPGLEKEREAACEERATIGEDCLEGRIVSLLLQLPDEVDG